MTEPGDVNGPLPIKAMLRQLRAAPGGAIRAKLSRGIDAALFSFWEGAVELYDGETAAIMAFALCSFDTAFDVPPWLLYRFRKHQAAIVEATSNGSVRQVTNALEQHFLCK